MSTLWLNTFPKLTYSNIYNHDIALKSEVKYNLVLIRAADGMFVPFS